MPLSKLIFKPGANRDQSNYASEGSWFDMDKVRFRSGFPEKIGGWRPQNFTAYIGSARSVFTWGTTDGSELVGVGTNEKIYVSAGTNIYDITPLRTTLTTPATDNCINTTNTSTTVTINVSGHGLTTGDYVTISGVVAPTTTYTVTVSYGVFYINGAPQPVLYLDEGSTYIFDQSDGSNLGHPLKFSSTTPSITLYEVGVTYNGTPGNAGAYTQIVVASGAPTLYYICTVHGAGMGNTVYTTGVSNIGGVPITEINAEHEVTVTTASQFTITATTAATSTTTNQGGTAISIACQITTGNAIVTAGYGWGTGTWARGTWGSSSTVPILLPPRLIFQDKFNNDLVFNIRESFIYYWEYVTAFNTRAVLLSALSGAVAVPQQVTKILFSPQGFLLALGCTSYNAAGASPNYLGTFDPMLVRWSNVDADIGPEPENWQPTLTNTAGFLRLQAGSAIVTGISTKQEVLVWTETTLTSLQFLGTSEVFGQQLIANAITIMAPNVVVPANNVIYWMGNDKFYIYSGRVDTLPCTLRQYVFDDINRDQADLFFAGSNAEFNEVIWFYCSSSSSEIDRYVIYNYSENIWYFGTIQRTAWIDAGLIKYPLGLNNGYIYYHELGHDDGQPLGAPPVAINSYIQSADIDIEDGDKYMLMRRVIPDVNFTTSDLNNYVTGASLTPEATITVGVRNFPGATSSTTNVAGESTAETVTVTGTTTATINQYTNQVFVRARGRQMNFKISSTGIGVQWQLGMPRVDARPDGLRN